MREQKRCAEKNCNKPVVKEKEKVCSVCKNIKAANRPDQKMLWGW